MTGEVLEMLLPQRGGVFVDCTLGAAGHAQAILAAGADRLIGIDRDHSVLEAAGERLAPWSGRVDLVHADYRSVSAVLDGRGLATVDGILADLGLSSMQIEGEGRGFSFQRDEPLDMRMDTSRGPTAAELIAQASEQELARVIFEYGEERHARRVARAIVQARDANPITTTGALAVIARRGAGGRGWQRIDPATRTFQAIRIWVNDELAGLDRFIGEACGRLSAGGRIALITFHSLEDRIVKHTLRGLAHAPTPAIRVLTKKPARPGDEEVARNPRSRSAKLRAAERLAA